MSSSRPFISFIVPVYNETLIIEFATALYQTVQSLPITYEILFIDDGSQQPTQDLLAQLTWPYVSVITLSRNFGKEAALTAGLEHCQGDAAILLDGDFQHPLELIAEFIVVWQRGIDMVYGVRMNRNDEKWLKRFVTRKFYQVLALCSHVVIPIDAGDFRLLDRKVITALLACEERTRFMKGLYAWVGFSSQALPFQVQPRALGRSSWSYSQLINLAITALTAFSETPLRLASAMGLGLASCAFIGAASILIKTLLFGIDVPGYASLLITILFLGGLQLLAIGILGEYVGRIFNEVKQRPRYIVQKILGKNPASVSRKVPQQDHTG